MKIYCEGLIGQDGLLNIKLSGVCEDSGITIIDAEVDNSILTGICKVMIVHGVVPLNQPLKLIKSFTDFVRTCIFPFVNCITEDSNQSETDGYPNEEDQRLQKTPNSNVWCIELHGLPWGVLEDEVCVKFLNNDC